MKPMSIMVQATGFGTGQGKSFLVALFCKLFRGKKFRVSPFKTLNLTSLTYLDEKGKEFAYVQALQAVLAQKQPDWRTNPFTPKPVGGGKFDLFLEGNCIKRNYNPFLGSTIKKSLHKEIEEVTKRCFESLSKENDIICIEGSGPAKLLDLEPFDELLDLANMGTARITNSPVIFVTDNIDSVPQTLSYLSQEERERVKGVILNKFPLTDFEKIGIRKIFLDIGLKRIKNVYEKKVGLKILGILPDFEELSGLPDLDPIAPADKIPFDTWKEVMDKISKKAKRYLNLKEIYKVMKPRYS